MTNPNLPTPLPAPSRHLTAAAYQRLADVPPEIEWFANLGNKSTRRAYENALKDFMAFTGIVRAEEFRTVNRAHVIAWRDELVQRGLSGMTVRHRLAALSSLFEYLCEKNAVTHNPVKGVKRPPVESYEGKTPALGDHQARSLLDAPDGASLKGKRDRAMLSTLLYHALRREELCKLKVKDFKHERRGVAHLKISGKGGKTRYVPLHPAASGLMLDIWNPPGMPRTRPAPSSVRSTTTVSTERQRLSRRTRFIKWCGDIQPRWVLRSRRIHCERRPRPMRSIIRPTSPKFRNG